jgi:hypothetical protein
MKFMKFTISRKSSVPHPRRAPSVAAKLRLMARSAALAVLGAGAN